MVVAPRARCDDSDVLAGCYTRPLVSAPIVSLVSYAAAISFEFDTSIASSIRRPGHFGHDQKNTGIGIGQTGGITGNIKKACRVVIFCIKR